MKKIYYVFLMMAIALAACEKTDQPKEQPEEQPEEQQEPEKPQEPQVYPSSSITVLSARQGTSTPEDEVCTKLFDGNFYDKWCSVTNFAGTYENRVSGQGGFDYIIWKTESSIVLCGYMLTTGNDTAEFTDRNWKTWAIYGAAFTGDIEAMNNPSASGWTLIQRIEDDTVLQPLNNTNYYFEISDNSTAYKYYKLEIEAIQSTIDNVHQMSEMTLYTL